MSLTHHVVIRVGTAVVGADGEELGVALHTAVVQLDAGGPRQVGLLHRVLQAAPGVREPVRHLPGSDRCLCTVPDRKVGRVGVPKARTTRYKNSFIPASIQTFN